MYASGVVLSAHGRIITAVETGGLHYMMTLHTLFFEYLKFCMYFVFLSSHCGFKSSSGRVQFVQKYLLYKRYHTTAGFKSVSQNIAQQRVADVKKFSKFSESTFDSLPGSGISQ